MTGSTPNEESRRAPIVARFEMAITPADFQRLAPLLPGANRAQFEAMSACCEEPGGRRWQIILSNPRTHSFARLSVPLTDVEIEMTGYNPSEAQDFLERFHLIFRRGGG